MKIGLIGANGQVGAESALYLAKIKGIDIVCFVRSDYSRILLDLANIPCDVLDFRDNEKLKKQLSSLDAVLDFTYPSGQTATIAKIIATNTKAIMAAMAPGSAYLYMSSIMAFGMPDNTPVVKNYRIAQTTYAQIKRRAEKIIISSARRYKIKCYNLRLSQVHGVLQSVTPGWHSRMTETERLVFGQPADLTNTIFISSMCEAFLQCINGACPPGTYTLVSQPQWSLSELHGFYKSITKSQPLIKYLPFKEKTKTSLTSKLFSFVKKYRQFFETHILLKFPKIVPKIKGRYRVNAVAGHVRLIGINAKKTPDYHLLGKVPGAIIPNIQSGMEEVLENYQKLFDLHTTIIEKNQS